MLKYIICMYIIRPYIMTFFDNLSKEIIGYPTQINLFIYKINNEQQPFIQFILENNTNTYTFPNFTYRSRTKTNYSTLIMNRAILLIQNVLQNNDRIDEIMKTQIYKGCISSEQSIWLFFDCSFIFDFSEETHIYAIVSEVINQDVINNIQVDNSVKEFMLSNSELNQGFSLPLLLYGCKNIQQTCSIFDNLSRIFHPIYGNYFYFTREILGNTLENTSVQRFVVFTKNHYLTSQFKENNIDYWLIKTESQIVKI